MSESDNKFKQRIIGALVLVALAIIFLPMLFKSKDETALPAVRVEAPPMPRLPEPPAYPVEAVEELEIAPVVLPPEPEPEPETYTFIDHAPEPVVPPAPVVAPVTPPAPPVVVEAPVQQAPAVVPEKKPDTRPTPAVVETKPAAPVASQPVAPTRVPESWAIQLGSLGSLANAEKLRNSYQARHYSAYIRSADGVHKVFIGPLIREAEAQAMCKQLKTRDGQDCFVVRYQP